MLIKNEKFTALYYPYSRCFREVDLKRMVLIFEEILFVDPLSEDLVGLPGQITLGGEYYDITTIRNLQDSSHFYAKEDGSSKKGYINVPFSNWFDIQKPYTLLQSEGAVRLLDMGTVVEENDELLCLSVISDFIDNHGYLFDYEQWLIHRRRIPSSLKKLVNNDSVSKLIPTSPKFMRKNALEDFRNLLEQSEEGSHDAIVVPYDMACSLITNQALLLCEKYSAFPVTDDKLAHHSLLRKCKQIYNNDHSHELIYKQSPVDSYKIVLFTLNVVGRMIPDSALHALSFDEILLYRQKNRELLVNFWARMIELSNFCKKKPFDQEYSEEVIYFIESKVVPEIIELDKALKHSYKQLFNVTASKIISETAKLIAPLIPTMTLASIYGLSPIQIVTLGASAFASNIGAILPGLVSDIGKHKQLSQNGLAYLLNFVPAPG